VKKRAWERWWEPLDGSFLRDRKPALLKEWKYIALADLAERCGGTTLEIGCASCIAYPHFKKRGLKYTGFDITKHFLEHAKKLYPEIDVDHGTALDLPFEDASLDIVFCKDLLEHLQPDDVETVVNEMWRVSKKQIMISFFIPPSNQEKIKLVKRAGSEFYQNQYSKSRIAKVIENLDGSKKLDILDKNHFSKSPIYIIEKRDDVLTIDIGDI